MKDRALVVKVTMVTELTNEPYPDYCAKYFSEIFWNDNLDTYEYTLTERPHKAKMFPYNPSGNRNADAIKDMLKALIGNKAEVDVVECEVSVN